MTFAGTPSSEQQNLNNQSFFPQDFNNWQILKNWLAHLLKVTSYSNAVSAFTLKLEFELGSEWVATHQLFLFSVYFLLLFITMIAHQLESNWSDQPRPFRK